MSDQISRINNYCLVIITLILTTAALNYTKPVLVPFVFAIFIYEILNPLIIYMQEKLKLNRIVSSIVTMMIITLFISIVVLLIVNSMEHFIQSADTYKNRIAASVRWFSEFGERFGFQMNTEGITQQIKELPLIKMVNNLTGDVMGFIGNLFLILFITLFLVLGGTSEKSQSKTIREIQNKVSRYLATKSFTSTVTGVITWIVLIIGKVELAFMFGILTILFNFIPTLGSIIATLLPLPIVLLQYGLGWQFYFTLVAIGSTQIVIGNIIEPKLMGESLDLHPITLLISLIFWGLVWGTPGMFLAVPITASIKIIFTRIETTRPLAELLAGRFASAD